MRDPEQTKGGFRVDKHTVHTLTEELRNGSQDAFAQLYEEWKTPVFTIIFRIVQSKETAEDVMQDVFIKLYRSPPDRTVKNPRAWFFACARNAAIDALRKKSNSDFPLSEVEPHTGDPIIYADTRIDVETALSRLPQLQREIVTLHINAQLGFSQIAGIVGHSLSYTYRQYRLAIQTLQNELNGGITR